RLFDTAGTMTAPTSDLQTALATLRSRWGAAAPGYAGEVVGSLATVPLEAGDPAQPAGLTQLDRDGVISTGFAELDAILGPGGVPRGMGVALRGDLSSGRTTLALRLAAEAQATGIRRELARRSWIRLGRDVVGQRTEVIVARSRAGPPGRRATLEILYADGGERDACLRRADLWNPRPVQLAEAQGAAES